MAKVKQNQQAFLLKWISNHEHKEAVAADKKLVKAYMRKFGVKARSPRNCPALSRRLASMHRAGILQREDQAAQCLPGKYVYTVRGG